MNLFSICRTRHALLRKRLSSKAYFIVALFSTGAASADPLTLEQAWRQAEQANPTLLSAQGGQATVEGELSDARSLLWNNPQIATERRRRDVPQPGQADRLQREWTAGLSQTFEIAGQQGARRGAAEESLSATRETIAEIRRQLRADVEQAFVRTLSLQQRMQTEHQTFKLIDEAASAVRKRVAVGEDSRIDGNLAKIEAERAQNQIALQREELVVARAELAAMLQLPPAVLPETIGDLDPAPKPYTLETLLTAAANRPALRALDHKEKSARSRLDLERAAVYPDVTVGISAAREGPFDARERIAGVSISLPLPLFRRNDAGIGRATAELTQTQIDRQSGERNARAQVVALWERVTNLQGRVKRLRETVLPSLEENQRLSTAAFRAGEIGLTQLLLVSRQVLDGRRDLLDARTDLRLATIALEAAAGWTSGQDKETFGK